MNDVAWFYGKDLPWKDTKSSITKVVADLLALIASLSSEELVNEKIFSLGYEAKSPKPLIEDLLYEIVEHPLHHMMGMYNKFGNKKYAQEMLAGIDNFLQNPMVLSWTSKSCKKIAKYLKTV